MVIGGRRKAKNTGIFFVYASTQLIVKEEAEIYCLPSEFFYSRSWRSSWIVFWILLCWALESVFVHDSFLQRKMCQN